MNTSTENPKLLKEERLEKLVEIFLDRSKEELEDVVNSTSTLEEAIECIFNRPKRRQQKRRRSVSPEPSQNTEESSGSIKPVKKRTRKEPLALQDSFTDSDATLIDSQNRDALVDQLRALFPRQSSNDLERILENQDWSVERAANILHTLEEDSSCGEDDDLKIVSVTHDTEAADRPTSAKVMAPKTKKRSSPKKQSKTSNSKTESHSKSKDTLLRKIPIVISSDEEDEDANDNGSCYDDKDSSNQGDENTSRKDGSGGISGGWKIVETKDSDDESEKSTPVTSDKDNAAQDEDENDGNHGNSEDEGAGDSECIDSDDSYEESMSNDCQHMILSFFNDATVEELQTIPGCSKMKAVRIQGGRPFHSWKNLCDKFESIKGVNIDMIWDSKTVLEEREVLKRLMNKCSKISGELQKIVSRTLEAGNSDADTEGQLVEQPQLLNSSFTLKPYQMIGLNWLVLLHRREVNGILADEMGLGKTIQAIAFLAHLMEMGDEGPYLIVVPSSTMDNWIRELNNWCPALEVLQYFGSQEDRRMLRAGISIGKLKFNVMVTTYNMCISTSDDRSLFKKLNFHYLILDEAHMLKNMNSQRYKSLLKIRAERRLLLTGTPLQNNLLELMSLLCFVMPNMFIVGGSTDHLKRMFASKIGTSESDQSNFIRDRIAHAKQIMQPFVLRRIKTDVLKQLPKKCDRTEKCPLSASQQKQYCNLIITLSTSLKGSRDSGQLAGAMMQLRKMANHGLLHRHHYDDGKLRKMSKLMLKEPTHHDADPNLIFEDMGVMSDFELHQLCNNYSRLRSYSLSNDIILNSGKFQMLDKLLPTMKEKGDRVLLFSQFTMMLDIIEVYMKLSKHKYQRLDGRTPVQERLELIDRYNNDDDIFVFLLSTKAGGLGINLTAANVVILHDIDFNPYNDKQAEDRCHRVGQTRDVTVIRLISENTIEEAILQCANGKLKLEKDMTTNNSDDDNTADMASLLREALDL
ncbi:SWI/SNF-related matrix-associated actin-dependent regulator of chromatin subfamily A containing DEAD/H box 1-like [Ptychodera flava]|uniref:SWI/SNF-related matrix-associated actin-dependent regulator of chromatin subfamily A containing DEAD/H box 1-like n=1 Tax=Ptychodera flava TaxID=63121 RepID=UPI003969E35E